MRHIINVLGTEIAYEVDGAASLPPIVLMHAFPLNAHMWDDTARVLGSEYRVIRPHWRGFGPAALPAGAIQQLSMDDLASDIAAVCAHARIERAALVGCSIGGYVLCALLRTQPQLVSSAVFSNSRPEADTEEARQNRYKVNGELQSAIEKGEELSARSVFADRMVQRLLGATTLRQNVELAIRVRAWIEEAPLEAIVSLNNAMARRPDSTSIVAGARLPVLIIAGEEDKVIPVEAAQRFQSIVPGSSLVVLPEAGHLSNLESPKNFSSVLLTFLRGRGRAQRT